MRFQSTVFGMAALAASTCGSFSVLAAPCPSTATPLATYVASGFSCTVNDKTISGVTASVLGPSFVTPVTDANNPGLTFAGDLLFVSGSGTIAFTITAPASDPMTDASLAIMGSLFPDIPATAFGTTETLSNGTSLSASETLSNTKLSDSSNFPSAATSLNVTDNLSSTDAVLTSVTNQFSETPVTGVPEPSSLGLLGLGLSAFALARRRRTPSNPE